MGKMKIIKEVSINENRNNINGIFKIYNKKIFYKILSDSDFIKEIDGYSMIKQYYKTPKLYFKIKNKSRNILGYEYNENVSKNNGLLIDYFVIKNKLDNNYYKILNNYKNVFLKTIKFINCSNYKIFFDDRINTRLKYNCNFILELLKKRYFKNKADVSIDNIYKSIKHYYKVNCKQKKWCVISQCDPNDLNICIDGTIFDFTAGGYVPIMAEFATFFWYNLIQCEYLSPKYNPKAFKNHNAIHKKIRKNNFINNKRLDINIRPMRLDAIIYYMEKVILPVLLNIDYKNWYYDFKNYLAMKALAVFDFKKMSNKDIYISIKYLKLFYLKDFKTFKDFIKYMKEWRHISD